jgi:hypothetical protein
MQTMRKQLGAGIAHTSCWTKGYRCLLCYVTLHDSYGSMALMLWLSW